MIAGTLLAAPTLPAIPVVLCAWLIGFALAAEPLIRDRTPAEPDALTAETVTVVHQLRPAREAVGSHG
jgi:hypothetical protein